jgi:ferredoxin--NADP+ reductase
MNNVTLNIPAGVFAEKVTFVKHYTDRLFKFRITRPQSFRFRSGEFVMIGLPNSEKPIFRAYSIASPSWDEQIEFYSIKVEGGPLTEHLQKVSIGDTVLMRKKPTGTLVNDALLPGERLYLFSTGTGIAPFASLIRDPETYEKFNKIILCHTCRKVNELEYGSELMRGVRSDPLIGELAKQNLLHYPTVTQENYIKKGRITNLIKNGEIFKDLGYPEMNSETDRGMICGSMDMLNDTKSILESLGLDEGSNSRPSTFVVERAFVS